MTYRPFNLNLVHSGGTEKQREWPPVDLWQGPSLTPLLCASGMPLWRPLPRRTNMLRHSGMFISCALHFITQPREQKIHLFPQRQNLHPAGKNSSEKKIYRRKYILRKSGRVSSKSHFFTALHIPRLRATPQTDYQTFATTPNRAPALSSLTMLYHSCVIRSRVSRWRYALCPSRHRS